MCKKQPYICFKNPSTIRIFVKCRFSLIAFLALVVISCKKEQKTTEEEAATATDTVAQTETPKIVSLSGTITEIVSALGHESDIVGVDVTSTYPEGIKESAQDLGHSSKISIEAVMAVEASFHCQ